MELPGRFARLACTCLSHRRLVLTLFSHPCPTLARTSSPRSSGGCSPARITAPRRYSGAVTPGGAEVYRCDGESHFRAAASVLPRFRSSPRPPSRAPASESRGLGLGFGASELGLGLACGWGVTVGEAASVLQSSNCSLGPALLLRSCQALSHMRTVCSVNMCRNCRHLQKIGACECACSAPAPVSCFYPYSRCSHSCHVQVLPAPAEALRG